MKPLLIDLFAGLGGWAQGGLAEGYTVIGFDIERHVYGEARYPAQLVLQDVLTLHGAQFKDAALIVASPPCQAYSYRAMPWKRAKALPPPDNTLFEACFRIQREACEAARRHIPLVVENVCAAQKWVGRARWHYGSFYLWGDVPALMPIVRKSIKGNGGAWFKDADTADGTYAPGNLRNGIEGVKCGGSRGDDWFAHHNRPELLDRRHTKNTGGSWFAVANNTTSGHGRNPDGRKVPSVEGRRTDVGNGARFTSLEGRKAFPGGKDGWFGDYQTMKDGIKQHGSGREWFAGDGKISRLTSSGSSARKAASAHIAKIPLTLARWIARMWYPIEATS